MPLVSTACFRRFAEEAHDAVELKHLAVCEAFRLWGARAARLFCIRQLKKRPWKEPRRIAWKEP